MYTGHMTYTFLWLVLHLRNVRRWCFSTNKLFIRNLGQQKGQELQKDRRQWSFSNVLSVLRPWVKEDQNRVLFFCVIKDLILRHISGEAGAELLALVLRGGRRRRNNSWRWDLRKPERVMSDCLVKEFTNDSGSHCEVTKKLFKGKWLAAGFALYVVMYYNRRLAHICIYLNTYYKKKYTSMASSCIGQWHQASDFPRSLLQPLDVMEWLELLVRCLVRGLTKGQFWWFEAGDIWFFLPGEGCGRRDSWEMKTIIISLVRVHPINRPFC